MSDHDEQQVADRLAALEAKLDAKAVEAAAVHRQLHTPPRHPGGGAGFNQEAQHRQDAALHERRRRHEEWQHDYDERLARVAPKVAQLEAKLSELDTRRQELERRHAVETAKVQAEADRVRREIGKLSTPPPMPADPPSPDAVEMVRVDAGADWGVQYIPKEVYDAQNRRRQSGRKR
jgi:DNA repair exonuclease SbcCD ATPase subunit